MHSLIVTVVLLGYLTSSSSSPCDSVKNCVNEVISSYNRTGSSTNHYTNAPSCASIPSLSAKQQPVQLCFSLLTLYSSNSPCPSTVTGSGVSDVEANGADNGAGDGEESKSGHHGKEKSENEGEEGFTFLGAKAEVWLFAFGSVIAISVAGFACVLILPSMCTVCYNHFQQFLVAMAVGTLSGDAVLHLIPHSFFSHEDHGSEEGPSNSTLAEAEDGEGIEDSEQKIVLKGVVLLLGLFMLYTIEQLFAIVPLYTQARRERARLSQQTTSTRGRLESTGSKTSKMRPSAGGHGHSHGGHGHSHGVPRDESHYHYSDVGTIHDHDEHGEQMAPLVHFHDPCATSVSSHHHHIPPSVAYSTSCEDVVFRLHGHTKLLEQKECALVAPCNHPCVPETTTCVEKPPPTLPEVPPQLCPEVPPPKPDDPALLLPQLQIIPNQQYKHGTVLHRCHSADNINVYCCTTTTPVCLIPNPVTVTEQANGNGNGNSNGQLALLGGVTSNVPDTPAPVTTVVAVKPATEIVKEEEKPERRRSAEPRRKSSEKPRELTKYPVESAISIVTAMEGGDHSGHGHGHSHGHSHGHGHSHSHFGDVNSRAWMVILADAFHNLVDGMAIGVAFSSSLAGGFSTAIAVAMHELPHELGDFAVLLKEGLSIKRGLMFNALSSVICLIGASFGVAFGSNDDFDQIIFALAAGVFLYVSLVDMLPQISTVDTSPSESVFCHLIIRCTGMLTGTGIMVCVAMLESRIGAFLKAFV